MKTTDKIALVSVAIGAIVTGIIIYLGADWHWGWSAGIGFLIAAGIYDQGVKQIAAERVANRDVSPKS